MHRFFDHTADSGVELEAASFEALAAESAVALLDLITGDPESVLAKTERAFVVTGLDDTDLLVALGNELLFLFEVEGFLCRHLAVAASEGRLECVGRGEILDPARHPIETPIKAVTHHMATVSRLADRWTATLVYDL